MSGGYGLSCVLILMLLRRPVIERRVREVRVVGGDPALERGVKLLESEPLVGPDQILTCPTAGVRSPRMHPVSLLHLQHYD
ncbi:MAG TPA: hypothetical protein PLU30_06965 [Verrucomicrobiae bacterium]|nr:hypothetical protein [Verrucomicrobiae bacterium]